jgi:tRNA A64-2'-O-ribosylphosphate transferase
MNVPNHQLPNEPSNLTESDLLFSPQANHNFSRILTDLKRSNLSITNRLRSIREDASFVSDVAGAFQRPLIANERCGSWYIAPEDKVGSAYFKSTDGHTGQWKFSTRRLNLQLLKIIEENDGCIIVDSTRRGKRMPDALSKTIPIWCCVLNHALFPDDVEKHGLFTPPNVVSESEHAQINAKIPGLIDLFKSLGVSLEALKQLRKPMRPMWVTQESQLLPTDTVFEDFHPVICCTSSRRVTGGEMSEGGYIQGAGDDTENWALGLTPPVFWKHGKILLSTPEADLPGLIISMVAEQSATKGDCAPQQVAPYLFVHTLSTESPPKFVCTINLVPETTDSTVWAKNPTHMEVGIGKHKLASRNLRTALPQICHFVGTCFAAYDEASERERGILISCENGKDVSVGVALALLCQFFDSQGNFSGLGAVKDINKTIIKVKLGHIMTQFPEANPSRATLQSVNSFLMG